MEIGKWKLGRRMALGHATAQKYHFDDDREGELRGISSLGTM
jgi:hypothetical protein